MKRTGQQGLGRGRRGVLLAGLVAIGAIAACGEDYEGGAGCPLLCPEQNVVVFDTVFDPVELDTTIVGFPTIGSGTELLLAYRGDTVDTRPVIRFDSLPLYYNSGGADTIITHLDSAYLRFTINKARSLYTHPVTFELFNVDTIIGDSAFAVNDTSTAIETTLFRPDRMIGSITIDSVDITDSVRVPLDSLALITAIVTQQRLRIGIRAVSEGPVQIRIISQEGGDAPVIHFSASQTLEDLLRVTVLPLSSVPRNQPTIRSDLVDYTHVLRMPTVPHEGFLAAGGVPGRRAFIRFLVPSRIIDSANVLRATLELTQVPTASVDDTSHVTLFPVLVTAGKVLADPGRSAFLTNPPLSGFDSVTFVPRDSGLRQIEIVNALRAWAVPIAENAQRAIVLQAGSEGVDPRFVAFFSSKAADPSVRPRLRLSYSPVRSFGIP